MTDDLADNAKVQFVICIMRRIAIVVAVGWAMRICLRGSTYANFGGKFKAVLLSALNARLSTCLYIWLCVYLCLFACVCVFMCVRVYYQACAHDRIPASPIRFLAGNSYQFFRWP